MAQLAFVVWFARAEDEFFSIKERFILKFRFNIYVSKMHTVMACVIKLER